MTGLQDVAGTSSVKTIRFNIGGYFLVKLPVRKVEYRYIAVINQIHSEQDELTVTYMESFVDKGLKLRLDENDASGISFNQIVEKIPNSDLSDIFVLTLF